MDVNEYAHAYIHTYVLVRTLHVYLSVCLHVYVRVRMYTVHTVRVIKKFSYRNEILSYLHRITIVFVSYYDRIWVVLRSCLGPITIVNWILYDRKFHRNDRISVKKIDFVRLREESNALCLWMLA